MHVSRLIPVLLSILPVLYAQTPFISLDLDDDVADNVGFDPTQIPTLSPTATAVHSKTPCPTSMPILCPSPPMILSPKESRMPIATLAITPSVTEFPTSNEIPSATTSQTPPSTSNPIPSQASSPMASQTSNTNSIETQPPTISALPYQTPTNTPLLTTSPNETPELLQSTTPSASTPNSMTTTTPGPNPSQLSTATPSPTPSRRPRQTPTMTPRSTALSVSATPTPAIRIASVGINVGSGGPGDISIPGTDVASTTKVVTGTSSADASVYKTARQGDEFEYSFTLNPGSYDIVLGFIELNNDFCDMPGRRVFNVFVNNMVQIEGLDVFTAAGRCLRGLERVIAHSVGVDNKSLKIRLASVVNPATLSYIKIRPSSNACVPVSLSGGIKAGEDHSAHAVPGTYPPQLTAASQKSYTDRDGDGYYSVLIDGSGSHTHNLDDRNGTTGKVVSYRWTVMDTAEVLSTEVSFRHNFPLGTTRLKLTIMDNFCSSDVAETTVTVTGVIKSGMYCYFYKGLTRPLMGGIPLSSSPAPAFARQISVPNLNFPAFPFSETLFHMKCMFFLETKVALPAATVMVSTEGSGHARLYKGTDLILDTSGSPAVQTGLPAGLTSFELVYERTTSGIVPSLQLTVDGDVPKAETVTHDRRTVLPVLSSISPITGPNEGGTLVKVSGYGLFTPITVDFGGRPVRIVGTATPTGFFVRSPPRGTFAVSRVKATNEAEPSLSSASVKFRYGSKCDAVKFDVHEMKTETEAQFSFSHRPTCAIFGGDGKIYVGTIGGTVQVLGYNSDSLTTTSHCYSQPVSDSSFLKDGKPAARDILGITFNPSDTSVRPYVSSGTLYWFARGNVDKPNPAAWRNGAIDRLRPGTVSTDGKVCLVYDKRIVTGLPVSDHDHSVNGILFTQGGDLLITVGGNTNAGLPGRKFGGHWETRLSTAILIARLSKPDFKGIISYTNADSPRHAERVSGDVDVYCSGLRNAFTMTMTGTGDIYASDQGPNETFGNMAVSCTDYDEAMAATWNPRVDWPGDTIGRPDKIVHITEGSFYGHANIQRGGDECSWIDPFNHKTPDDKPAPTTYKRQIATLRSAITGIGEYRSQHFCGRLRGKLILSALYGRRIYKMGVNKGLKTSGPDQIFGGSGGITFVEAPNGDLIFVRLSERKFHVLRPRVTLRSTLFLANAVPFRHGAAGGTTLTIGGRNFGKRPKVKIGGKDCKILRKSRSEVMCRVPPGSGIADLTLTKPSGTAKTLPGAVLYMQ